MPVFNSATTGALHIAGNPRRQSLTITNNDSTNVVYLRASNVNSTAITTASAEFSIGPGLTLTFIRQWTGEITTTSPFQDIAGGGTPQVTWGEGL